MSIPLGGSIVASSLSRVGALARAKLIEQARDDINIFIEYALRDNFDEPLKQAPLHRRWHAHVDKYARAGILAPRDHGKSLQFAVARPIWELGRNPNLRVKIVCNDLPKARKRLRSIRSNMTQNTRIQDVFPHLAPDNPEEWTLDSLTVRRSSLAPDPSIETRGVLTAGTGSRADLIIFDDICDYRNSIKNPNERERVKSSFFEDWINLLEPDGRAVVIGTLWHRLDTLHALLGNSEWVFLKTLINGRLDPIWPEKWPREALAARRKEIGDIAFARSYQGIIRATTEESYFNHSDLEQAKDFNLTTRQAIEISATWPKYVGVDLSSGKRTRKSNYAVIFVIAVDPATRQRLPVAIERRRERSTRFMQRLAEIADAFAPSAIIVENNAVQSALIDMARDFQLKGLPIKPLHTGREKADLEIGLPGLAAEFECGLWRLPFGGPRHAEGCQCNLCLFLDECRDGMLSQHTDILMAAWMATRLLMKRTQKGNWISSTPRSYIGVDGVSLRGDDTTAVLRGGRRLPHYDPGW